MVYPIMEDYHENTLSRLYARRLAEDSSSKFSKRFNALICALDTGITSVAAEEVDWADFKFPGNLPEEVKKKVQEDYKYDIKTQHPVFDGDTQVGNESFEIRDESAGTKSLFVIGGIILGALERGGVLVVDEFEKTLHPSVSQFLISLFHNPIVNPLNAQLIFATHDITQLSNDHFRRDQVWFTEKNEFGATSLIRFLEYA
jgi:predicted ATPase